MSLFDKKKEIRKEEKKRNTFSCDGVRQVLYGGSAFGQHHGPSLERKELREVNVAGGEHLFIAGRSFVSFRFLESIESSFSSSSSSFWPFTSPGKKKLVVVRLLFSYSWDHQMEFGIRAESGCKREWPLYAAHASVFRRVETEIARPLSSFHFRIPGKRIQLDFVPAA